MTQPTTEQFQMMADLFGGGSQGELYAGLTRSALNMLDIIPVDVFEMMVQQLDRVEAFGPFVDPTAFIQPNARKNLDANKKFAKTLLDVRRAIEEWKVTRP